jgi:hypothetical protein
MIIANPIYDVVFKYLLEDTEIAREFLSAILGEEIESLEVRPQETTTELSVISGLSVFRYDFVALVKSATGLRKVLIELQKVKQAFDVTRFRKYLGENYRKEDSVKLIDGQQMEQPLPIVTIYFLGFSLDHIKIPALSINREYRNAISGELIKAREDFVELLTHDSYLIQIPHLKADTQTKLERFLQIFSPVFKTKDPQQLDFRGNEDDPILKKMLYRLVRAIASDEMRHKMDVEDEIERSFEKAISDVAIAKDKIIAKERQKAEKEKQRAEKEKQRAEKEKQKAEKEKQRAEKAESDTEKEKQKNVALLRQIEELQKLLSN